MFTKFVLKILTINLNLNMKLIMKTEQELKA